MYCPLCHNQNIGYFYVHMDCTSQIFVTHHLDSKTWSYKPDHIRYDSYRKEKNKRSHSPQSYSFPMNKQNWGCSWSGDGQVDLVSIRKTKYVEFQLHLGQAHLKARSLTEKKVLGNTACSWKISWKQIINRFGFNLTGKNNCALILLQIGFILRRHFTEALKKFLRISILHWNNSSPKRFRISNLYDFFLL